MALLFDPNYIYSLSQALHSGNDYSNLNLKHPLLIVRVQELVAGRTRVRTFALLENERFKV